MTKKDKDFLFKQLKSFLDSVDQSSAMSTTGEKLVSVSDVRNLAAEAWVEISVYFADTNSNGGG